MELHQRFPKQRPRLRFFLNERHGGGRRRLAAELAAQFLNEGTENRGLASVVQHRRVGQIVAKERSERRLTRTPPRRAVLRSRPQARRGAPLAGRRSRRSATRVGGARPSPTPRGVGPRAICFRPADSVQGPVSSFRRSRSVAARPCEITVQPRRLPCGQMAAAVAGDQGASGED